MAPPMSDDPRIIRFPGSKPAPDKAAATPKAAAKARKASPEAIPGLPPDLANLSEDQRKAVSIVLSGMGFVLIGIKPGPTGADFFTALHGEPTDLRNAAPHLPGVIERAYERKGM